MVRSRCLKEKLGLNYPLRNSAPSTAYHLTSVPESLQFNFKEVILVLVAVNTAFLTSLVNDVGLVSVVASFLFAYVVAVAVLMRVKNASRDRSLVEDDHSFVSEDTVKGITIFLHKLAFAIQSRTRAVRDANDLKGIAELLAAFYLVGVVGNLFGPLTIIWIVANAVAFASLLANNEKARKNFDNLTIQASGLVSKAVGIVTAKIPKYSDLKRD